MSMFKRPKKTAQRRVFSLVDDGSDSENDSNDCNKTGSQSGSGKPAKIEPPAPPRLTEKPQKNAQKSQPKSSLLSFDDEDEGGEVFQVKKSSHSKKVMKQLDKERKKRKNKVSNNQASEKNSNQTSAIVIEDDKSKSITRNSKDNATEVVLDDFVLRVKNVEPDPVILNGRAALCAGRDDMSSEDDDGTRGDDQQRRQQHQFMKPDNFKILLESGGIPDAAMIHAARKSRQKAREQGEFIPLEENQIDSQKTRYIKDDEEDGSDNERVDMSAINGAKEMAERREQFYAIEDEYDESDPEITEWENQQLRKGVTGAQIASAQQESAIYSQYLNKQSHMSDQLLAMETAIPLRTTTTTTGYLKHKGKSSPKSTSNGTATHSKPSNSFNRLRMPKEVQIKMEESLEQMKQLNLNNRDNIEQITKDIDMLDDENEKCKEVAPIVAEKYRYYQELRGFMADLIECLDEKVPQITDLEKRFQTIIAKQSVYLIKRRHQDVRDQAQEISESGKPGAAKKMFDDEDRVRRAADREGRRTRRRQIREKMDTNAMHMDGMSSDDEIHPDHEAAVQKSQIEQIIDESLQIYNDTTYEFSEMSAILERFEKWRMKYMETYKDVYFHLCLPKILGPMIRIQLIAWNPLLDNCDDIERMEWYQTAIQYGWQTTETECSLNSDPDNQLIPILIEKIILPKLTEIIDTCWDPLSTTQVLRLVGLIRRFGHEYPTLRGSSKYMQTLFQTIIQKIRLSLDNDIFIPIYAKQMHETARMSFFQRQFANALKLFRNILSWQGILSDQVLKELAITSLLNRYFLPALRVCTPLDATAKAYVIMNTLPRVWLQHGTGFIENLNLFTQFIRHTVTTLDKRNPLHFDAMEKLNQILHSLHALT